MYVDWLASRIAKVSKAYNVILTWTICNDNTLGGASSVLFLFLLVGSSWSLSFFNSSDEPTCGNSVASHPAAKHPLGWLSETGSKALSYHVTHLKWCVISKNRQCTTNWATHSVTTSSQTFIGHRQFCDITFFPSYCWHIQELPSQWRCCFIQVPRMRRVFWWDG